ncbi:S1 RNA-binding domain-containing protein [Acetobacterium tundrae]|uniref:RNA-binding protein n=1 Tax=Acetobacterium tundrae TaxID=132932 RepID=A0ABR6WGR3_9FIRM|nr:S1-like domain-containing RNA-binding protein [Acetobacterium tundrae]MBC3795478.1 RNA-binding protein [Acetobacterium tundrae]
MIEVGKVQTLKIERITAIGAYLSDGNDEMNAILLPEKEVPKTARVNDEMEVFVYRDSQDRFISTTRRPKIQLGEFAALKVVDITKVGAFLDWGLEKDLLLPYNEQTLKVQKGRDYLVNLYTDKSDRLCATMKIYPLLKVGSTHKVGEWVEGYVYQINPEIGAFVAIENLYHGLILMKDADSDIHCGEKVHARISEIRNDGKLILSPNKKAYKEIPNDAITILTKLNESQGFLPFNDKSDANIIKKELNMSKSSFKRAVGKLLKEKKIRITERGIEKNGR